MSFEESVPEGIRLADMLISSWPTPGTSLAIDVSVVHPLGLSHLPHLIARSDAYLEQAERVKENANTISCGNTGWQFAPVIFSTFEKVGPKGKEVVSKLFNLYASSFATEKEREKALWQLQQQLQVAMKKAVAQLLQIGVGLMITPSADAPPPYSTYSTTMLLLRYSYTASKFGALTTLTGCQQVANEPAPMEITLDQPFAG